MAQVQGIQSFADYRTVSEAAEFLGVSTATLRNWDRNGKLKPRRHPKNGYRIYRHEDLAALCVSAGVRRNRPLTCADVRLGADR